MSQPVSPFASRKSRRGTLLLSCVVLALLIVSRGEPVRAQIRVMPLGDSITQGGQTYASYRYDLWFDLAAAGYSIDFVGQRDFTNDGSPNPLFYPDYFTTFDRDHEAYWGWRTDQIAGIIAGAAAAAQPDLVLIHLGTNDIGQLGAGGVTNADVNLRLIIDELRQANPDVTILLAQVIPIGPGTSYFDNADQVAPLNTTIAAIASDMDTAQSPVLLVDQNTGFDPGTMMQSDGLHPDLAGEARLAIVWQTELEAVLPDNAPPDVTLTSPVTGTTFTSPVSIVVTADATDPDGFVTQVDFVTETSLLGVDSSSPYGLVWSDVPVGNHVLTAVAEDDQGATRASAPVAVTVLPPGSGLPVPILNPSFEEPPLADGSLAAGPGTVGNWVFTGTANTFVGIFNPPAGSYPAAGGDASPAGADGANVAYLFNNGGPTETVSATQQLGESLQADSQYTLAVAIGKFLPDQPYVFSTFGGYRIDLLAGATPVASTSGIVDPPFGEFQDALLVVDSSALDPVLIGQPLSIRLDLATDDAPRSTHFDSLRLTRSSPGLEAGRVDDGTIGSPLLLSKTAGEAIALSWSPSCLPSDSDYAVHEGALLDLTSHAPRLCSTSGTTTVSLTPAAGDRFYLVVPHNTIREGSYGRDGAGIERPAAAMPCLLQQIGSCP